MSKNDDAWEALFEEHNILQDIERNGFYKIDASSINKKREARLMTKFDHVVNLPQIFLNNNLTILPDSRSSYVIGKFECYAKIQPDTESSIIERPFPSLIESLSPSNLYSESSALLCAYHAGLIADVLEEEMAFTVFGRMSTGRFDFSISTGSNSALVNHLFEVDRAQCEIDGAFEGVSSFAILEVKNEDVQDFHIRQLYFPYRLWLNKVNKKVIPVFLTYSNEIFTFSVYEFEKPTEYNSLKLVKKRRYQIVPTEIEIADIRHILSKTKVRPEPASIPFPQADRFERIIDLLVHLYVAGGSISQEDITTRYSFDLRQTRYYTNGGIYLGLIERIATRGVGISYALTESGLQMMQKAPRARNFALIELILQHRVFRDALEYYLLHSSCPSRTEISEMMQKARLLINGTTSARRSQTVIGWIRWIMRLTTEE
jgi:hypothetical protein